MRDTQTFDGRNSGVVLLMVLAILGIMSVLALTFVSMSRLERAISQNYVSTVRVRMICESGIESGINALRNTYGVMTWDEMASILYYPHTSGMVGDAPPQLEDATLPSLDEANGVLGDGITSAVEAKDGQLINHYSLRIEDESGKFNLNSSPGVPVPDRVYEIVQDVCFELFGPIAGDLAVFSLFNARNTLGGRFSAMSEVEAVLKNEVGLSDAEWSAFDAHFTITSWFDESVIEPTYAQEDFKTIKGNPAVFISRGGDFHEFNGVVDNYTYNGSTSRVLWDSYIPHYYDGNDYNEPVAGDNAYIFNFMDTQTSHFKIGDPRAPINVNTCKKALLRSLIKPVQGWYIDETGHAENFSHKATRTAKSEWFWTYISTWLAPWPTKLLYYDIDVDRYVQQATDTGYNPSGNMFGGRNIGLNSLYGVLRQTAPLSQDTIDELTDAIWNRIHVDRVPFSQWQEFETFIRSRVDDPDSNDVEENIAGFTYAQADALISNFNPNAHINDYNPDSLVYRLVDKAKLNKFTNEICFEPTGTFSVHSYAVVTDLAGSRMAEVYIHAGIRIFEYIRISTQAEFMAGYEGNQADPDSLYYEPINDYPVQRNATFTESAGLFETAGSDFYLGGKRQGFSLTSYPEPLTRFPGSLPAGMDPPYWHKVFDPDSDGYLPDNDYNYLDESIYDGYLGLATWQARTADMGNAASKLDFNMTLRPTVVASGASREMIKGHSDGLGDIVDDVATNYPANTFTKSPMQMYYLGLSPYKSAVNFSDQRTIFSRVPTPGNYPTADRLMQPWPDDPLDPRQRFIPGVLHADGALSDSGRAITFHAANVGSNLGKTGSVLMWVKPNFDPAYASRIRTIFTHHRQHRGEIFGHMRPDTEESFEFFYLCRRGFPAADQTGFGNLLFNEDSGWAAYNSFTLCNGGWASGGANQQASGFMDETKTTWATNHSFSGASDPLNPYHYNFETRKWNHIGISWRYPSGQNYITINGQPATRSGTWGSSAEGSHIINMHNDFYGGSQHNNYWGVDNFNVRYMFDNANSLLHPEAPVMRDDPLNYARLGGACSDAHRNYVSDCTYDEVFSYQAQLSNGGMGGYFQDGRFCGGSIADSDAPVYTSAPINVYRGLKVLGNQTLTPRSVTWTLYWPMTNDYQYESGNLSYANANVFQDLQSTYVNSTDRENDWLPFTGLNNPKWDPIVVDLYSPESGWIFGKSDADLYDNCSSMLTSAAGGPILSQETMRLTSTNQTFQFRLYFNIKSGEVIYDTPVVDEVNITFNLSAPSVLFWVTKN